MTRLGTETDHVRDQMLPFEGQARDYDSLLERAARADIVMIGEASHGTAEFYRERARITRLLIENHGFNAVATEADWPDSYRVNRFVRGESDDHRAATALGDFRRFPAWMWRNTDVVDFIDWLRIHNALSDDEAGTAGFYGLDLYSLRTSIDKVVEYLDKVQPRAAAQARDRYSCFDMVHGEGVRYAHALATDIAAPCEEEVVAQLTDLRNRRQAILSADGRAAEAEFFFAEQNARLVLNAERYYRTMYRAGARSWNLRDTHMVETLGELDEHLRSSFGMSRVVVWAHNTHIGDARATDMARRGEVSLGSLARQHWPGRTFSLGLTTAHGTVTAADEWGAPARRKRIRPPLPGSYEELFHQAAPGGSFWLDLSSPSSPRLQPRLERAIGVIYRPETERSSHWFRADISRQFDAVLHIDVTSAVIPLERTPTWDLAEPPETYPTGL